MKWCKISSEYSYQSFKTLEEIELFLEFVRIEHISSRTKLTEYDNVVLFRIIDLIPLREVLEKIIFARYKYNILIKHEAVIRAIDLGYTEILDDILLLSPDHDLVKTAISQSTDDTLLSEVATGGNQHIPSTKQGTIQKLALQRIQDDLIFFKTGIVTMDEITLYTIFQKLQKKATLRGIPKFYIRLIPVIMHKMSTPEVMNEFDNIQKYSQDNMAHYQEVLLHSELKH